MTVKGDKIMKKDIETIIRSVKLCSKNTKDACSECVYDCGNNPEGKSKLLNDVLAVLNEWDQKYGLISKDDNMKLKPCPFCGSKAKVKIKPHMPCEHVMFGYYVTCSNIKCHVLLLTGTRDTKEEAIEAWNTRADNVQED